MKIFPKIWWVHVHIGQVFWFASKGWFLYHYVTNVTSHWNLSELFLLANGRGILLFCHRNSTVSNINLPAFCADLFSWFSSLFLSKTSLSWLKYSLTLLKYSLTLLKYSLACWKSSLTLQKYSAAFQTVVALLLGLIKVWLCEWTKNNLMTLHVGKSRIRIKWQFQPPPLSIWHRVWPRESR